MRERILAELKAKFTGVSDAILGRIADKLAKTATTEEQVKPAVDGVTFQQILESYGDSRATEAQQTAVANYEKKHGLKDGVKVEEKPVAQPATPPAGGADVPEWAKTLIESNKAMTDRLNKMETQRTTDNRRKQLDEIVNKLPENLRKGYQRISVDDLTDEAFSTLLTDVTSEVDGIETDLKSKGAVFNTPTKGAGQQTNEQLSEAEINAINARGAASNEEQPF